MGGAVKDTEHMLNRKWVSREKKKKKPTGLAWPGAIHNPVTVR